MSATKPIFEEHQSTLLRIGAAGQLMLNEKLAVLPCEGKECKNRPIKNGKVALDRKAIEAREDAIVRNLLKHSGTCVLVLGGAHALSTTSRGCRRTAGMLW